MSKEISTATDRDAKGKFLVGNGNRWKKGFSGHPAKLSPRKTREIVRDWLKHRTTNDLPLTWSSLAIDCGMTISGLNKYRAGTCIQDQAKSSAIMNTLQYAETMMEADLERKLTDKNYSTAGVQFALKNRHSDRWSDTTRVEATHNTTVQYIIDLPDNRPEVIAAQAKAIDGEYEEVGTEGETV